MSTLEEVAAALPVLAYGFTVESGEKPEHSNFEQAFASKQGQSALQECVTLLHCTTEYPVPMTEVNLRAMQSIHTTFGVAVDYSDHTSGIEVAIRNIEIALGDGVKRVTPSEARNKPVARKSLVASRAIKTGEIFGIHNVTTKRPGTGISPMRWDEFMGCTAPRDFSADELIDL